MPFVATVGSGAAQGLGQNLTLPTIFSGVPIENFFQTGTVRTGLGTTWSITCLGMPGKTTTSTGWGLMLIKVGQEVSGTLSYTSGVTLVWDSLLGVGNYIQVGVGTTANATALTGVTGNPADLTFTFGTSAVTSGSATTKIVWKYFAFYAGDSTFGFTHNYYGGDNTANRVISGTLPAVTWQPFLYMVLNSSGTMSWYGSGQSRAQNAIISGYTGSGQTQVTGAATFTSLWGTGIGAGVNAVTVGRTVTVATLTNETGRQHIIWMFDTSSTYGSKQTLLPFNRGTYSGAGNAKTSYLGGTGPFTHGISMMYQWNTTQANPANWTMDGFGTSDQTAAAGVLAPNPFNATIGIAAEPQAADQIGILSFAAGTSGWNTSGPTYRYYSFLLPVSDFYVNAAKFRPFSAGFKSQQKITAGGTTATISINPNRYPMNMSLVWVISANGTGAVSNKIYSRHAGYYAQTAAGTQFCLRLNGQANLATDTGGYDGESLRINNLVSTTNYAVLINYLYPNMFDCGTSKTQSLYHNLQTFPTFGMFKTMDTTATVWRIWTTHDQNAYYTIDTGTFTRTAGSPWGTTPPSGGTLQGTGWNGPFGGTVPWTFNVATMYMVWADSYGVQQAGKYAGASAVQTVFTNFTVGSIIIFETTEGMFLFTEAIGMTAGNNYRMNLSGTVANAVLGDVCLQASGGFQLASTTTLNTAGRTYYFMAFAQ